MCFGIQLEKTLNDKKMEFGKYPAKESAAGVLLLRDGPAPSSRPGSESCASPQRSALDTASNGKSFNRHFSGIKKNLTLFHRDATELSSFGLPGQCIGFDRPERVSVYFQNGKTKPSRDTGGAGSPAGGRNRK